MSDKKQKHEEKQIEKHMENSFVIETIKKRPLNHRKLLRQMGTTVVMAVIFGVIACMTFILVEPFVSKKLTKEEEIVQPNTVTFTQVEEEMSPEQMLSEYMAQEAQRQLDSLAEAEEEEEKEPVELPLDEEQVKEILSQVVLDKKSYRQVYTSLAAFSRELSHYMVTITASQETEDWLSDVSKTQTEVSGVIIAENGVELLLLADYTNLKDAEALKAAFYNGDVAEVYVKAIEEQTNLAILAVNLSSLSQSMRENLPIATMGNSDAAVVGIPLIAVGSPMGTAGSVSYGIISANKTIINDVDATYSLLQTDISGSTAASGVLFNLSGNIIGIITDNHRDAELGNLLRAYGISDLKSRIENLSNGEPIGYVGITGCDVPTSVVNNNGLSYGAYVLKTEMDSPAMKEGIQSGDVIISVNGTPISSYAEYTSALRQTSIGSPLILKVQRYTFEAYREMYFTVTVSSKEEE